MDITVSKPDSAGESPSFTVRQVRGVESLSSMLSELRARNIEARVLRKGASEYELLVPKHQNNPNAQEVSDNLAPREQSGGEPIFVFDVGWQENPELDGARPRRSAQGRAIVVTAIGILVLAGGLWIGQVLSVEQRPATEGAEVSSPTPRLEQTAPGSSCGTNLVNGQKWPSNLSPEMAVLDDLNFGGKRFLGIQLKCDQKSTRYKVELRLTANGWEIENAVRSQ
ncbi:MAG: hypothetical protein ACKORF_01110 [Micrococcales bacterium]